MENWALFPPIAFLVVFGACLGVSKVLSQFAYKGKSSGGALKSYACGEEAPETRSRVDYYQFFPFAFFFTVLHVITLMVATIPAETVDSFAIALLYLLGAVTGLVVLFRR